MSEKVEHVARALALSRGSEFVGPGQHVASRELGWDGDGAYLEKYVERHWKEHVHAATFAIQATREPTEAMLEAGDALIPDNKKFRNNAGAIFRAMVDEALK